MLIRSRYKCFKTALRFDQEARKGQRKLFDRLQDNMLTSFCNIKLEEFITLLQFQPMFGLLFCVLNLVFSVVATLGNLLVIRALFKAASIPANLKKLFLSLAFTDLAVGLYLQPMLAIIIALMMYTIARGKDNFDFLCPVVLTVNVLFAYFLIAASFFTIAAIALDRFIAVTLHLRYQEHITEKRVHIAISIIWLTSGLSSFALTAISSNNYLVSVIIQMLGLLVITIAYIRIYKVVRHHQNQIQSQHQIQNGQAVKILREKKSAWNSLYVYFLCLICYLPSLFASTPLIVDNSNGAFLLAFYTGALLSFLNSSLNPVVYCWRYQEIRNIVKSTVKRLFRISTQ